MTTTESVPFGALLQRLRSAVGLTQEQLAARAQLSRDAIAALESGKRRTPRRITVRMLSDALGLAEQEHAALVAAARAGGPSPVGSAPISVTSAADFTTRDRPRHAEWLVAQPTPLVGRTHEVETILQRFRDPRVRLLTLVGPAGVGKTRLALAAATHLAADTDRFSDGVIFVDLSPVRDAVMALSTVARAVGLLDVGRRPLLDRLIETLAERQQLVVVDNVEQVLPAVASLLAELLPACPRLALLVTSRAPLGLRWEQTLRVAPLPVPDPTAPLPTLDQLLAIPSVELFVGQARARRADFALREQHAQVVVDLVTQLDGLPLALELAAARLDVLSLPALARRLDDRLRLLASAAPDRPERQQSLEAAIGWSYELLSEEEQRLFRCLGVFVGRVSLDAITAVVGEVSKAGAAGAVASDGLARDVRRTLPRLLSLAEKSLVLPVRPDDLGGQYTSVAEAEGLEETVGEEPAFAMLETVREYAQEQLVAATELAPARRAHAHAFLALAERADPQLRGRDQRVWYMRLERELDNLRAAQRWLLDQDNEADRMAALRMAAALSWFLWRRGCHAEGIRWLEEALARSPQDAAAAAAVVPARIQALTRLALYSNYMGETNRAHALLREALELAEMRQEPTDIVEALAQLGQLHAAFLGQKEEGMLLLDEALRRSEALGNPHGLGFTLFYLGLTADLIGDLATAAARYTTSLKQLDVAGDAQFAGFVHCYFGVNVWKRGDLPGAVAHIQASLAISVALRDRWLLSYGAQAAAALVDAHAEPTTRARLLGAVDATIQITGASLAQERLPGGQDVAELRERLGREQGELAAAYREGRMLPFAQVAELAMRLLKEIEQAPSNPDMDAATTSARQPTLQSQPVEQGLLTAREVDVLQLVAQGKSSKEIGQQLFLSPSTVNQHIKSIFNKLGVNSRAQAVGVAAQRGLLEP